MVGSAAERPCFLRKSSARGFCRMNDRVPNYRKHKQSGQAVVTLTDSYSRRKDVQLGKYGTKQSRVEYARVIAEWEASGRQLPVAATSDPNISELMDVFWDHVEEHYRRPDGSQTTEVWEYKLALRPLRHRYGHTPVKNFGP